MVGEIIGVIVAVFLIYAIICSVCGFDIIGLTRSNWLEMTKLPTKKERFVFWKKHFFRKD